MSLVALFVDEDGPYGEDSRFDAWGVERDARTYDGHEPGVYHPPCQRWGGYAWGSPRDHTKRATNDEGTFHVALSVCRFNGGVLEHPAYSLAWEWFNLPIPPEKGWSHPDAFGGRSCRVDQGQYGHVCNKPTWLYAVLPVYPSLKWEPSTGKKLLKDIGSTDKRRWQTPPEFKEALHDMAASCIGWKPKRDYRQRLITERETKGGAE